MDADRYAAYPKALPGCEIQPCWAHEIRKAGSDALHPDATPEAGELADEIKGALAMAKDMIATDGGRHSRSLRIAMESELSDILDRHAGSGDPIVRRMAGRIRRALPSPVRVRRVQGGRSDQQRIGAADTPPGHVPQDEPAVQGRAQVHGAGGPHVHLHKDVEERGQVRLQGGSQDDTRARHPLDAQVGTPPAPDGPRPPAAHAGPGEEAAPDRRRWAGRSFPPWSARPDRSAADPARPRAARRLPPSLPSLSLHLDPAAQGPRARPVTGACPPAAVGPRGDLTSYR